MLLLVIGEGISLRLSVAARDGLVFVYFEPLRGHTPAIEPLRGRTPAIDFKDR